MPNQILVPSLGESVTEATVAKWLKQVGEEVDSDEPLVELETDKVNIEVPSPLTGTLSSIKVKEGEYPYHKGQLWADPNIDQAAAYMRRLVEDDLYRNTVAKAGYSYIKSYHSFETVGKKYRDRLVELGLLKT